MTSRLLKAAALAALAGATALAQTAPAPQRQNPTQNPPFGRRAGRMGGPRREGRMRGARLHGRELRDLNLTDAQRQQLRDIEARYAQSFRPAREELRKLAETRRSGSTLTADQQARAQQLREELRANAERMRAELQNVLTAEQRQQLQQRREEMKQRREQFEQRRDEFRQKREQRRNGTPPPAGNANGGQ